MIDIIGYWIAITLFTALTLSIPLAIIELMGIKYIESITGGDVKLVGFTRRFFEMNKTEFGVVWVVQIVVMFLSIICFMVAVGMGIAEGTGKIISAGHEFGVATSGFFGWTVVIIGLLVASHKILSKGYQVYKKVNTFINKAEDDA